MTANGFTRQWAIRLPSGELFTPQSDSYMHAMFGLPVQEETQPVVFDTRREADYALEQLRKRAAQVGIPEWFGVVVERICSPFTSGDPCAAFAADVQRWLFDQDGAS